MASQAISGYGTELKYSAGTIIGELTSIGGIKLKAETIDVTNHDSVGNYKEFIASLKDAGDFPVEGNFIQDDAGQLALMASFGTSAVESFIVTFPDLSKWEFTGIVTGIDIGKADIKSQLTFGATIKISGQPVFTGVTTLNNVVFTVTHTAGGSAVNGATVLFNDETRLTGASGVATFPNVEDGTYTYGIAASGLLGEAATVVVNGDEAVAVDLAAI